MRVFHKPYQSAILSLSKVVAVTIGVRLASVVPQLPGLRRLRLLAALSQKELAARAQMSQTTLSDLETGKTSARPSTVRKLATALGCTPAELIEVL